MQLEKRVIPRLLVIVILAVCVFNLISVLYHDPYSLQWDFHTYYHASMAHATGLNPYQASNISLVSGKNWTPPYLYPPLTLYVFSLFHGVDYSVAAKIWLFLKISLMTVLVFAWNRYFTRTSPQVYFLIFLLFSFASAVYWDLKTGNVSILEQFLLWTGFLFLIKEKTWGFCLMLLLASVFKLAFLVFLPLLLVFNVRHKWLYISVTALSFAAYVLANFLFFPDLFSDYINLARAANDLGDRYNLGTLALVKDAFIYFGQGDLETVQLVVYAGLVALLLSVTIYYLKPFRQALTSNRQLTVFLFCALYAILMPRMKCYSFIILIMPSYYVLRHCLTLKAFPYLFLLLILPIRGPFDDARLVVHFKNYYSLYLAYVIWGMFIWHIRQPGGNDLKPLR